jgi:ABC-type sugar transport system ATPase subunit
MAQMMDANESEVIAEARTVTHRYPGVVALDSVDFSIRRGEVRALLGQNGAGKSTLIRLLSGVETPTEGQIIVGGSDLGTGGIREATERGVSTCYQELSLVTDMTVAENFFLGKWPRGPFGISFARMAAMAAETLQGLGAFIDPYAEVSSLTLAEQQIVEIARALRNNPKLLILDEPTSALAASEVSMVLETVRRVSAQGVAVLYVSHRMDEIRQIAETATIMRNGTVIETVSIAGSDTATIIELMIGASPEEQRPDGPAREFGDVLLEVKELSVPPKLSGISFAVRAGEILGIAGLLGSGRTELLRAIAGYNTIDGGTVSVRGDTITKLSPGKMLKLGIGMTPENRKATGVILGLGIDENIVMSDYPRVSRFGVLSSARIADASTALASKLNVKAHDLTQPIGTLSGGNQQKAVIARWLHADSSVLLLDEPTRGVDVEAKAQIYEIMRAVADTGKGVIFVSSEVEELPLACDRVLVIQAGTIGREFIGPHIPLTQLLEASMASHV